MADFTEVKSAAELNTQSAPAFVPSQAGVATAPSANEEAMLRAMFNDASAKGLELNDTVTIPQAPTTEQPPQLPIQTNIPEKFQKPDGTVDEDKLKASSARLDEAIQNKEKTVDELLADYKEREKKFAQLGQQTAEIKRQMPQVAAPIPEQTPDLKAMEQRIREDYMRDPLNTSVQLAEAIVTKRLEPFMQRFQQDEEVRRDQALREGLAKVAQQDPRILDPRLYAIVNQVLDEEPGMRNLKNPHKAAWNEVKERLRLGEPTVQAQPSIPNPTLGRGTPPFTPSLPGPMTAQNAYQQATTTNPYSEEGKAFEEKLRDLTRNLWQ